MKVSLAQGLQLGLLHLDATMKTVLAGCPKIEISLLEDPPPLVAPPMKAKPIIMRAAAAPLPGSLLWVNCSSDGLIGEGEGLVLVTGAQSQGTNSVRHRVMELVPDC